MSTATVYSERFPQKTRARREVARAKRRGILKQQPCEKCGATKTHAHHDDYAKPLDVRWLCALHHKEWHAQNGQGANGGAGELLSPGTATDISGHRFGGLTVIRRVDSTPYGVLWECRCGCGSRTRRTAASLNYAVRAGAAPSCRDCASGRFNETRRRRARLQRFLRMWKETGSLYCDVSEGISVNESGAIGSPAVDPSFWELTGAHDRTLLNVSDAYSELVGAGVM